MMRLTTLAALLALAGCSSGGVAMATDSAAIAKACGGKAAQQPIGGAPEALWFPCEGNTTFLSFDRTTFHSVPVPDGVVAQAALPAADKSLWVTTRDAQSPSTTNARKLWRLKSDGSHEDHSADVNPAGDESLQLLGLGGIVVVLRGSSLYVASASGIQALPAPLTDVYRVLRLLPVLGEKKLDRFFINVALGAGSPGTPDDTRLFLWTGSQWQPVPVSDPDNKLSDKGLPKLFVPVHAAQDQLFGLTDPLPPQNRTVTCSFAHWDGLSLTATSMTMVIEVGMFGVKQLYVLQDQHVVLLGAETEGDTTVADRLAYYVFSGTDVRDRTAFADVQTCDRTACTHAATAPAFLSDGSLMYIVTGPNDFQVWVGRL